MEICDIRSRSVPRHALDLHILWISSFQKEAENTLKSTPVTAHFLSNQDEVCSRKRVAVGLYISCNDVHGWCVRHRPT